MKTKVSVNESMGAGAGISNRARVLLNLGAITPLEAGIACAVKQFAPRAWSRGGAWEPVAIRRGARGAGEVLTDDAQAAVRRFVLVELAKCDCDMSGAAIVGDAAGNYAVARASAAMIEARRLVEFARGLGVDLGNLGAGYNLAGAVRPVLDVERGEPCDMARRSARFESLCDAFDTPHGVGTVEARTRRAARFALADNLGLADAARLPDWMGAGFVGPVRPWQFRAIQSGKAARFANAMAGRVGGSALGPVLPSFSSVAGLPARARRLDGLCRAFGVDWRPDGLADPVELVFSDAAARAERCGKRWVRGGSAKTAASKLEIGAGAASDDTAAHFVRLEAESVGIARGVWLDSIAPKLAALTRAGVRINRRIRRALVAPVPVMRPLSRWLTSGRVTGAGVLRQGGNRARVCVLPVNVDALCLAVLSGGADLLALSVALVLSRPVVVSGYKNPALSEASRSACESWEYAAVKGRDGREVGGGWAIQGAMHGLRDFLPDVPHWEKQTSSDEPESDDLGAAEWSLALDAAADRLGQARQAGRVADLVADGYSEKLAARLVADESAQASADQDRTAADLAGVLRFAPDSGSGSGMPAWVAESVRKSCDAARASMAERLDKARPQDKSKIAESDGAAVDLLAALESWVDGGPGLSDEQAAAWLADWDDERQAWSNAAHQRFTRLRKRAGIVKRDAPLCGRVVSQSRGAVCLSAIGRKSAAFRPSDECPVLTDEQAAAIAALVTV